MKIRLGFLIAILMLICGFTPGTFGQTTSGTISGEVTDERGGAIPGVTLTIKNVSTGITRTVETDSSGNYSIPNLEPGEYQVTAEKQGFQTNIRTGVTLTVANVLDLDINMSVGAVSEQVVISVDDPLIETTKAEISRVVRPAEIESLPNIGRNFVDFVKLSSGVAPGRENVGGGPFKEPDTGVGAAAAPRLSFGGQTELNSLIQVDGADNVQAFTGLPRSTPSQEAAREFRILNSTYLSEYGRALGGFVNIVTKSGTNDVNGSLYYFGMNDALNARSILNPEDADILRQHQFGGTIGGPVRRDETFFFGNYEGQRRAESNRFSQVILTNFDAINAVRQRFGLSPEIRNQIRANDYDQVLVKLDHRLNDKHNFSARYNILDSTTSNFLGGGGRASAASTTARNNQTHDQAIVLSMVSILSSNVVNEARAQFARRRFDFDPAVKEPTLEVTNLLVTGKSTSDVDYYRESRLQLTDNLSYTRKNHQFKVGIDGQYISDRSKWALFFPARIIFPNMPSFLNFTPQSRSGPVVFWWPTLTATAAHPGYNVPFTDMVPPSWNNELLFDYNHNTYGAFVQDQWNATDKLTLTLGLRYDVETHPEEFVPNIDADNFQPRVGFAYALGKKSVVRGGYGLFNDRLAGSIGQVFNTIRWSSRGFLPNARVLYPDVIPMTGRFRQVSVAGPPATAAAINFLTTGRPPANGTTSLADALSSTLNTPYSHQASLQMSHEIGAGIAVTAGYLYVNARELLAHTPNINAVQTGVLPTGKPIVAGRRFAELGNFYVVDNLGYSTYHGGTLEAQKHLSRGIGFHTSYTWSKTITNVDSLTNLADFPEGPQLENERSLSRQHLGHRLTTGFIGEIPQDVPVVRNFMISTLASIESGRRYNVFTGADSNADGNPLSDRPGLLSRNSFRGPMYASVDLRVARTVRFTEKLRSQLSVDFFNLFNRVNIRDLNMVYGSFDLNAPPVASFNTPRDVFNPRQIQVGLKLLF
jgi:outer membrane receptor protein involved in Fe transport